MDRGKTITRSQSCGLILGLLLPLLGLTAPYELGTITQAEGEISYLQFGPPQFKPKMIASEHKFLTEGSYLTQDGSFLTVKLFEGSWLRLSPRSKVAPEFDPKKKTITLHLLSGSMKIFFSSQLNQQIVEKLVIKSADAQFESSQGKFTIVRNNLTDNSSVYVEKGIVLSSTQVAGAQAKAVLVHAGETLSIKDRETQIESPRRMKEKEMRYLRSSKYLKKNQSEL